MYKGGRESTSLTVRRERTPENELLELDMTFMKLGSFESVSLAEVIL